jgi:hypothetical protein
MRGPNDENGSPNSGLLSSRNLNVSVRKFEVDAGMSVSSRRWSFAVGYSRDLGMPVSTRQLLSFAIARSFPDLGKSAEMTNKSAEVLKSTDVPNMELQNK